MAVAMAMISQPADCHFFNIPLELRLEIYEHLFATPTELPLSALTKNANELPKTALLATCRLICYEAHDIYLRSYRAFFTETRFVINLPWLQVHYRRWSPFDLCGPIEEESLERISNIVIYRYRGRAQKTYTLTYDHEGTPGQENWWTLHAPHWPSQRTAEFEKSRTTRWRRMVNTKRRRKSCPPPKVMRGVELRALCRALLREDEKGRQLS